MFMFQISLSVITGKVITTTGSQHLRKGTTELQEEISLL